MVRVDTTATLCAGVHAMSISITASTLSEIIHGGPTATCIQPKKMLANGAAATTVGGPKIGLPVIAAGVISAVDDKIATAGGV